MDYNTCEIGFVLDFVTVRVDHEINTTSIEYTTPWYDHINNHNFTEWNKDIWKSIQKTKSVV